MNKKKKKATKKKPKPQRTQISDIRREELTTAALNCIIEKGYDKVTLEDVAREAGFSKGVAFYYFKKKDELLVSVLRKISNDFLSIPKMILGLPEEVETEEEIYNLFKNFFSESEVDFETVMRNSIRIIISWIYDNPNFIQVILEFWCKVHRNEIVSELTNAMQAFLLNSTEIFIEEGIKRGVIKNQNPRIAAYALVASLHGIAYYQVIDFKDLDVEKLEKEVEDLMVKFLFS